MGKGSRSADAAKYREVRELHAGEIASEAIYEAVSKALEGVPVTFNEANGGFDVSIQVLGVKVAATASTPWLALQMVAQSALEKLDFRGFHESDEDE